MLFCIGYPSQKGGLGLAFSLSPKGKAVPNHFQKLQGLIQAVNTDSKICVPTQLLEKLTMLFKLLFSGKNKTISYKISTFTTAFLKLLYSQSILFLSEGGGSDIIQSIDWWDTSITIRQLMPCHKDPIPKDNFLIKSGWLTMRSKEVISEKINIKSLILKRLDPAHSDIGMNCKVEPLRWPWGFCHVWTDPGGRGPVRCCHTFLIEQHDKYM